MSTQDPNKTFLFQELIAAFLNKGVDVTMYMRQHPFKDGELLIWFNLNTGMKSELELALIDDRIEWKGRYSDGELVANDLGTLVEEVIDLAQGCTCGRDYMNFVWRKILEERKDAA